MIKSYKSTFLYLACTLFIILWWTIAFYPRPPSPSFNSSYTSPPLLAKLSTLERPTLHQALIGNFDQMLKFILEWDRDAALLEEIGVPAIQRLSSEQLKLAQSLHHLIRHADPALLQDLNRKIIPRYLSDNQGRLIAIPFSHRPLIAQTYMAATLLLGIAPPKTLLAIPDHLRLLSSLYPSNLLDQIPGNSSTHTGEKLFHTSPRLIFISPYTHPPTIEALQQQKIPLLTLPSPNQITDIFQALTQIGYASHHYLEACLLQLFMEAAFYSIDNRFKALHNQAPAAEPKKVLYLYEKLSYTLPTCKCLSGQLLKRALECDPSFISPWLHHDSEQWRLPANLEMIQQAHPDCLLIVQSHGSDSLSVSNLFPFYELTAFKKHAIFSLEEDIQESPTQFIILAYFDLFQALATAHFL